MISMMVSSRVFRNGKMFCIILFSDLCLCMFCIMKRFILIGGVIIVVLISRMIRMLN